MFHTSPARHRARRALFALAVGMLLGPAGPWSAGLCLALEVPERKSALASTTAAGSPGDAARDSARTAAVQAARQGRLEPALQALRELAATSSDARVHHDLIVVLGWAGHHAQALQAWAAFAWNPVVPDYVRRGLADSLRALAEQAEASGDRLLALRYRAQAQAAPIHDPQASAAVARLLGELGGHRGAAWMLPSPSAQQRADQAALRLRLAKQLGGLDGALDGALDRNGRESRLDAVIAELTALMSELQPSTSSGSPSRSSSRSSSSADGKAATSAPATPRLLRQVQGDRAVAYAERRLWALALQDVQALEAAGLPLPAHVLMAKGAALLGLQRPSPAVAAYQAVLAEQPQDIPARWGLFYAWADQGQMKAAREVIDATAPDRWRRVGLDARQEPNPDWLPARLAAARVRLWDEDQAQAWRQLAELEQAAPDHAGVRLVQAAAAASRGWPRRAEQAAQAAHTLDEESPDVRLALAESALRRQQWALLRERLKLVQARAADSAEDAEAAEPQAVQRLRREVALAQGWQWSAGHQMRVEPMRAGLSPGESRLTSTRLEAPLMGEGWRPYWAVQSIQGLSPGVYAATRQRLGMGLRFQGPDDSWDVMALQESGSRPGPAWAASARHAFDDHWALEWGAARRSADAPLRAWANGIEVDSAQAKVDHAWHEGRAVSMGGQLMRFSDGNERRQASVALTERVLASAPWQLFLRPEWSYTQNTRDQGPYFSPLRESSLAVSLISQRTWWSAPDRRWSDRLELQAARQQQAGYAPKAAAALAYERSVALSPALELSASLSANRRHYDGVAQRAWIGQLRLASRF